MKRVLALAVLAAALISAPSAWADVPYVPVAPGVPPAAGPLLPTPTDVPGKEFTQNGDKDLLGAAAPGQLLWWDGLGGTINDVNYSPNHNVPIEIDGLANRNDVLFNELIANQTHLITGVAGRGDYLYHKADGFSGVWAPAASIDSLTPPTSVHDLEIWGPEPTGTDANRYSLLGDPFGVAVYSSTGAPEYTDGSLASAIANLYGRPDLIGLLSSQLDLDAMMVKDSVASSESDPIAFNGDSLIFSVAPLNLDPQLNFSLDGGEIFVYNSGTNSATWLFQGNVLWDTAHNVTALYGHENVTAIEAASTFEAPEPASIAILGTAAIGLLLRRRK